MGAIVVNFKEWLKERGLLAGYLRNRVDSLERNAWPYEVLLVDPSEWINHAFKWEGTPEGHTYWRTVHRSWNNILDNLLVPGGGDVRVEYGLPLYDKLGMTLILAEQEGKDG